MAQKRPAKRSATQGETTRVLARFQENLRDLQRDAEAVLGKTRRQAAQLISRDQRKAVDRIVTQAQRLRADLEKRAQRATKDVESRAERFFSVLEQEASKRLLPLLQRLDLPSRTEMTTLSRRIATLEKRVRKQPAAKKTTASRPAETRPHTQQKTERPVPAPEKIG